MSSLEEDTNERIRVAFLRLLDDKPYKKITFKELAEQTGMSRQNLYYYYKSKESVLEDIVEEFFERIYDAMMNFNLANLGAESEEILSKALIRAIAETLRENEEMARCVFSRDVSILFVDKQVAFLKRMLGSIIRAQEITVNDPKYIHYLAVQMTGSSYFLLREWLLEDPEFPVDRIVELGHPMVEQIIQSLKNN